MNCFEIGYEEFFLNEFKFFENADSPKSVDIENYLKSKSIDGLNINVIGCEINYLKLQPNGQLFFSCYLQNDFIIKSSQLNHDGNCENLISNIDDINLSQLVCTFGLKIDKILYFNKIEDSDIIIIFFSTDNSNHLVKYDSKSKKVMDINSFPLTSYFVSYSENNLDFIIDPNKNIYIILLSLNNEPSFVYPLISELESVLNERHIIAVQELFTFWRNNISTIVEKLSVNRNLNSLQILLHFGVPVLQYLNFLFVHHFVSLNVISSNCEKDNCTSSLANQFVEQLSNLTNVYINEAVNLIIKLSHVLGEELFKKIKEIGRLLDVLCSNECRFRKLVLSSRWSLMSYKKQFSKLSMGSFRFIEKPKISFNNWEKMEKNEIIKDGLLNGNLGKLKLFFQSHFNENLTDIDIKEITKVIILSNIDKSSWNDLIILVEKLGYESIQTLTCLCLDTTQKFIRNYIYSNLNLESQNPNYVVAKNLIDKLENALSNSSSNSSFCQQSIIYNEKWKSDIMVYVKPFIKRLKNSESQNVKKYIIKINKSNECICACSINLKLSWIIEFYQQLKLPKIDTELLNEVDLSLIDADYSNLLFGFTRNNSDRYKNNLKLWLSKWKNNKIFVKYLIMSGDYDLIISVLELNSERDCTVANLIIDCLIIAIIGSKEDVDRYTDIDQSLAKNVLSHLSFHCSELLLYQLNEWSEKLSAKTFSNLISLINPTLPIHYLCTSRNCSIHNASEVNVCKFLSSFSSYTITNVISNWVPGEFPVLLYYLLQDNRNLPIELEETNDFSIKSTIYLNSAIQSNSSVELMKCFLSQDLSLLEVKRYTMTELNEILYAALFSGLTYQEITESNNELLNKVNSILIFNDYWKLLKKRLLRSREMSNKSTDNEQYYEVNLYNFLYRCGIPLSLKDTFSWQSQNTFAVESKNNQFPSMSYLETKHHSYFANSNYSLDYVYYLSLGRPFQAFMAIVYEFTEIRKPFAITQDKLKEIVTSIHQIALSHINNTKVIGGCFGLLRLIGSSTDPLRCYLTISNWIIEWLVTSHYHNELSVSTGSHLSADEIRQDYELKTGKLLKLCISKYTKDRRISREILLRYLEELFLNRLKDKYYVQISEIIDSWSFVLYFCQLQGMEFSSLLLQYFAEKNEWLLFLCCAQIFGYNKDQVKLSINKFEDPCVRQHMTYIASKVEEFSSIQKNKPDDANRVSKKNVASGHKFKLAEVNASERKLSSSLSKEHSSNKSKSNHKFTRATLLSAAKDNLIELIFDCQINSNAKTNTLSENVNLSIEQMQLDSMKLLAFSVVLNHPFLSVLAYCSESSKHDQNTENTFENYLNCFSCFIFSSFPKKYQKDFWTKWEGIVKIDWREDETVELIIYAIKNRMTNLVADAFFVISPEKYHCISLFYSMITYTVDVWNPVQQESYLEEFCRNNSLYKNITVPKEKYRNKPNKDIYFVFFNRLLNISLLTSMSTVQNNFGSRFLLEWLKLLSSPAFGLNQILIKQFFLFNEINIDLLNNVLVVFFDFIDLEENENINFNELEKTISVNVKSKEFLWFVEDLLTRIIDIASGSLDYKKNRLLADAISLIDKMNDLLTNDKKDLLRSKLRAAKLTNTHSEIMPDKSLLDLMSMAFAGQNDKEDIVNMCILGENKNGPIESITSNSLSKSFEKVDHGITDSWRRLVIPEEWQEKIFIIPDSNSEKNMEKVSHVNCLLNEKKWIEACSYMIENDIHVQDANLILMSMNVACGKTEPKKLLSYLHEIIGNKKIIKIEKDNQKYPIRRLSSFNISYNKLNAQLSMDFDSPVSRGLRQSNSQTDIIQKYLKNVSDVIIHGQEIVEYIYTIYFVAYKMAESYLIVAKEEEFNVLTKILVGTCRNKISTADMYLGVVDIDQDQLSRFLAEVIVNVLRSELKTHLTSSIDHMPFSYFSKSQKDLVTSKSNSHSNSFKSVIFTVSPKNSADSSTTVPTQNPYNSLTYVMNSSLHEYVLKVAQRCQLRSDLSINRTTESKLMKAFYLQDLLILTPCHRKLGKILYEYYQCFSQEVFSCKEDAEFLVLLLIQCHNCFTEGGDTVGISHCLKSAKELSKILTKNSYFVLLAQLLCRIGRYGEMPYIFGALIENDHFELLLRKDMDKEGVIVPYILDYLSRYLSDDFEKIELVCLKYNCNYELAETQTKKANMFISKLRSQSWKNSGRESIKNSLSNIITNFLESCKHYFKVGCYKKVNENLRKAQFYKLQQKWLEDQDKIFNSLPLSSPIGRSLKISTNKIVLPETGFSGGVKIIDMNAEEAMYFMKRIPNFYTAFIIVDQLRLSLDIWIELIVHHVLLSGDENYLLHYRNYFGRFLSSNFVQLCINRMEQLISKVNNKSILNIKLLLQHCPDIFLVKRLTEKYQLNK